MNETVQLTVTNTGAPVVCDEDAQKSFGSSTIQTELSPSGGVSSLKEEQQKPDSSISSDKPQLVPSTQLSKKMDLEIVSSERRPFVGRNAELDRLNEIYQDHLRSSDLGSWPSERSVLIQGPSGTGKTALVQQFVGQLEQGDEQTSSSSCRDLPLILQGKYEEMTRQDPFSAIDQAFGNYFRSQISSINNTEDLEDCPIRTRSKILKAIGGETGLEVLRGVIPALSGWLTATSGMDPALVEDISQSSEQTCMTRSNHASTSKSHQLHYVFGRLVQALTNRSGRIRPLVLILDNLQWADTASLNLMVYLIKQSIPYFFLIGTHRKINDDKVLPPALRRLADYSQALPLENHAQEEITSFLIQELHHCKISDDPTEVQALASAVYDKTKGNFLFTLHLMEQLQLIGTATDRTETAVQCAERISTYTIGDAVSNKICHLPNPQVQRVLMLATFLGSQFTVSHLQALSLHMMETNHVEEGLVIDLTGRDLIQVLDVAVLEGLLYNNVGSTTYQFTHDGIQEAAYKIMPVGPKRDQMLYQVGLFLQHQQAASSPDQGGGTTNNDWMLFVAARHWTQVQSNLIDPLELAHLHLQCGSKAIERTAFEEASKCLQKGLDCLVLVQDSVQLWRDHYDLTLHLYQSAAQAELLLGHYEHGYEMGNIVLANAKDLLDKMPTYNAMDAALGLQDRHDEALKLNMEALAELKEVPTTFMAIRDFFQVKRLIRETSDNEILSFPEMTDPYQMAAARCLHNAGIRSYLVGKMVLNMAIILRQVKLILKHGLSAESPMILASYGVALISGMGHPNTGRRMGRLARQLASQQGCKEEECKTLYLVGSFIELWTVPFDRAIETFDRAHELGMMSGNHDFGYGAETDAIITSFVAGRPLEYISHRFQGLKKEVDQYNLDALKRVLEPLGLLLSHLAGQHSSEAGAITGPSCIDWSALEVKDVLRPDSSNHYTLTWSYLDRMILAFFMDNMTFAESMMKKFNDISPTPSYTFCTLGSFFSALVCARLARTSKSKYSKYKALTQRYTKEMKKLVDNGCTKNSHKYEILKAECTSLSSGQKQSAVQQAYDQAVVSAKESGCVHDHALANELAGEYLLRKTQPYQANGYLLLACSLYREWGAHAKVKQLLQKHGLREKDLPATNTSPVNHDENIQSEFGLGPLVGGIVADDMSALTPFTLTTIPENTSLPSVSSRWGNGGATTAVQRDIPNINAPPKPPMRPSRRLSG